MCGFLYGAPWWVLLLGCAVAILSVVHVFWGLRVVYLSAYAWAEYLIPWTAAAASLLAGVVAIDAVQPILRPSEIKIGFEGAGLYNEPREPVIVKASQNEPLLRWSERRQGYSFYYERPAEFNNEISNSWGGYVTFYSAPIDTTRYGFLFFEARAPGVGPAPDIRIRVAYDGFEPSTGRHTELVTYELKTSFEDHTDVAEPLGEKWSWLRVDLRALEPTRSAPNAPDHLVNKVVFFVDEALATSAEGEFWVNDIVFRSNGSLQ